MPNYFQGTINTLQNIIAQEKRANLAKETPQYQQALFNLMQSKQQALFQQTIRQKLAEATSAKQMLEVLAQTGDPKSVKNLSDVEQIPIKAGIKRKEGLPTVFSKFDIKSPDVAEGIVAGDPNALLGVPVRERTPLVKIALDPFERARQTGLGSAAAKAETTINSVKAIVGDVGDMFATFDKIPSAFKGNIAAGGTLGQVGKLVEPNVKAYYDTRQLTLANIAKKLGGEVGVLTDRDITRIERALPDVIDTPTAARAKKKFIYNYMDRRVKAFQKTARIPQTGIGVLKGFSDPNLDIEAAQPWEKISVKGRQSVQPNVQRTPVDDYLDGLNLPDVN